MYAESNESIAILLKVMRIAHLKAFLTPKIGSTGIVTWIIQTTAKMNWRHTTNQTLHWATAVRIEKCRRCGI
jgi:predicted membrane-bound dolichyl-phosphate-mannose-protein mannosyltransferase